MRFKVGDHVRIKDIGWYNKNKSKSHGTIACGDKYFEYDMKEWCGKIMTILEVYQTCYIMQEDGAKDLWTDEMIECIVEEENTDCEKCGLTRNSIRCLFMDNCPHNKQKNIIEIPEGYVLKDENDNVINATKIILEKKKKECPKTYGECCKVLGLSEFEYNHTGTKVWYRHRLMATLDKLMLCRDAYWKLYGEEMGLGKPWEPDWGKGACYTICCNTNQIVIGTDKFRNSILAFPTEEMRNSFYENFKSEIENCKEFL